VTKNVNAVVLCVVLAATMWLAGCGHYQCGTTFGNSTCSGSGKPGSGNISLTAFVYFVDPTASQMALEGLNVANSQTYASVSDFASPTVSVGADFNAMAVAQKKYLYLSSSLANLYAFSIDANTGALTALTGSPYAYVGDSLAVDPNGKFLFAGSAANIYSFPISSTDGSLGTPSSVPNNGLVPAQLVPDGLGKYLYVLTGSTITEFSYDPTTGALTNLGSIAPSMAMIASEPSGKYILGITGATAEVHTFGISSTTGSAGTLTELSTSATTLAPVSLAVDPNGTWVYTFNQSVFGSLATPQPMEGYTLSASGSLTALSTSPFTGLNAGMGLFDQSGEYLFTVAQLANSSIAEQFAYNIDTTSGAVFATLPSAGAAGNYVVTDAP